MGYRRDVLPLKPGAYRWRFWLADEFGTLQYSDCSPDFLIDKEPLGHPDEQWAGLLNLPSQLAIYEQTGNRSNLRAVRGRIWTSIRFR